MAVGCHPRIGSRPGCTARREHPVLCVPGAMRDGWKRARRRHRTNSRGVARAARLQRSRRRPSFSRVLRAARDTVRPCGASPTSHSIGRTASPDTGELTMTHEESRLEAARTGHAPWKKWGPYLAERQWGTVREDYGDGHDTWNHFSHEQARARAYRWGEDGLAGVSDDRQQLCFALALWNGADPILKERLFGLTNSEGNHGEDVKEYYFYLDSTPTHSYMRYLYKYPQAAFPYTDLVHTNARRSRHEPEYELVDTGVFDGDRYFDVFVEYAKADAEDLLIRITAINRGPAAAPLHVLPTLWFRNTWSVATLKPDIAVADGPDGSAVMRTSHPDLGPRYLYCQRPTEVLFTDNETNTARLFGAPNATPWTKDAFHEYVVHGRRDAVNPARSGTKAAAVYAVTVAPRASVEIRLRLTPQAPSGMHGAPLGPDFSVLFDKRRREADEFYESLTPPALGADAAAVMRQALAGMLWSKQYYEYDVARWLEEHGVDPYIARNTSLRNAAWSHMQNADIISMPDKWEYPWYAAWDLAFHTIALNVVDPDFAKHQLLLVLEQRYLHPSGQMPAYEWNFGDVNPPVHAWAAWFVYSQDKARRGHGDLKFLETAFQRLLMNFTWWVNRKDPHGHNVFEGGFLGLDNIGVFDRSAALPTGGRLEQADGTAWMAFYAQTMLQLSIELALHDPVYQDLAAKFYEHFLWIAAAMVRIGPQQDELWDEEDGFFYDVLRLPNGHATRLKLRSMVGLLPLAASTVFPAGLDERLPLLWKRIRAFTRTHPMLIETIAPPGRPGHAGRHLLAIVNEEKLRRILRYMLDEREFLSPFG